MLTLMEKSGCRLLEYSNQMHSLQLTGPIPNQRGRFSISNRRIASEVVEGHANIQQPEHDGPKTQNIVRSINRICQTMRPKDPQDLDFEMDRDFLDPLHPNSFCGPSPSTVSPILPWQLTDNSTSSPRPRLVIWMPPSVLYMNLLLRIHSFVRLGNRYLL
ncbi:hypothetical protein KP79_PYT18243 [Mizuhopecten yessoensis]|uniref:Uncharacterized protein n=1 Tax=Mizuhopecten yessoensis TaxID=6573 RepID=A0A210QPA1_MIZYE|nr:hypothetical protein KP79_PYT18243 [Mizuhopecten yessoensis]